MNTKEVRITNVSTKDITYKNDIQEIIKLNNIIWNELPNKELYYIEGTDDKFIEEVLLNNGLLLKAQDVENSNIVGFLIVKRKINKYAEIMQAFLDAKIQEYIEMDTVGVLKDYRGMHLQQKLIMQAEEIIRKKEPKTVKYSIATVHPYNIASLRNLQNIGYEIIEERIMYNNKKRYIVRKKL